jgi:hypothetical protein
VYGRDVSHSDAVDLRLAKLQQAVMKRTDERLGVVGELLNSARVVKYFAWERAMMAQIDEKQDAEQEMIWKRRKPRA